MDPLLVSVPVPIDFLSTVLRHGNEDIKIRLQQLVNEECISFKVHVENKDAKILIPGETMDDVFATKRKIMECINENPIEISVPRGLHEYMLEQNIIKKLRDDFEEAEITQVSPNEEYHILYHVTGKSEFCLLIGGQIYSITGATVILLNMIRDYERRYGNSSSSEEDVSSLHKSRSPRKVSVSMYDIEEIN